VIDKKTLAYSSPGVYFYTGHEARKLAYQPRRKEMVFFVKKVGDAMGDKRMQSLV
jgi:hypothetical protein